MWEEEKGDAVAIFFLCFSERVSSFSLDLQAIRGEAYAWALVLGSFDKLHEVGDLSYLVLHFV